MTYIARMQNLFDTLGLEPSFAVNLAALEKAYFAAQREAHPDRFVGKPEADRIAAILKSQEINDAYDTLKNPLARAEHLLLLNGKPPGEASPQLLMEIMELRERLADADSGAELASIVEEIKTLASECQQELQTAFDTKDYATAADETNRLSYLGKAMEEAHMRIYQLKASVAHDH